MPAAPRTPTPRRKRISDDRMLDAACREFAGAGFHAASVDRVAAGASTTKATVYARFGSKRELFAAALGRETAALGERLLAAYDLDPETPLGERLRHYVRAYFAFGRDRPDGFRLLFVVVDDEVAAATGGAVMAQITARVAELIAAQAGVPAPTDRHRVIASLIVGATHNGAGVMAAHGVSIEEAAAITEEFLGNALRPLGLQG